MQKMQPESFKQLFGVSHETLERLETYHALLLKWQKAINLVSPSTLDTAWKRHFADSAQLAQYIPANAKTIADIGSGAGFPGLVLAIMRPDIETHLIESDERKAQFLRTVSRETTSRCVVHDIRIEAAYEAVAPDLVTARALASLSDLCAYCLPWAVQNPGLEMLFLKGEQAEDEIEAARGAYDFELQAYPSLTAAGAQILHLKGLKST